VACINRPRMTYKVSSGKLSVCTLTLVRADILSKFSGMLDGLRKFGNTLIKAFTKVKQVFMVVCMSPSPTYLACLLVQLFTYLISFLPTRCSCRACSLVDSQSKFNKVSSVMGRDDSWPASVPGVVPTGECCH